MYKIFFKRLLDFIMSVVLLVLGLPFIIIGAIFIKIDSPGPVVFTQERIGYKNKKFKIYKLRTMDLVPFDSEGNRRKDKDRITKAGKIIRKLSIDELPQLLNIIKGEMSFIGPRPLVLRYYHYYTDEELRRHDVRPGITGLAQVNGRSNLNWEDRFRYDVYYVDNLSFLLDLKILFKTIRKIVSGADTSVTTRPKNLKDFDAERNFEKVRWKKQ